MARRKPAPARDPNYAITGYPQATALDAREYFIQKARREFGHSVLTCNMSLECFRCSASGQVNPTPTGAALHGTGLLQPCPKAGQWLP